MAALRTASPELRAYFSRHDLLDVYEVLLCGVIAMRPEDPLTFLEEKLREIMEKGLDAVLWCMSIDLSLHPKLKRISETYLNTVFGLDGEQLVTEELCAKARGFYSRNLMKLYFGGWMRYHLQKKNKRKKAKQKMALAVVHYNVHILRVIIQKWNMWVQIDKEKMALATKRLQQILNKIYLNAVVKAWHAEAHSSLKTKAYFEGLAKEGQEGCLESSDLTVGHKTSHLPEKALLQINFSSVKHKVQDQVAVNILRKWRLYVLRLNLRGCYSLRWPSFKSIANKPCRAVCSVIGYRCDEPFHSKFPKLQL
ncbi:hypothetical protein Q9966_006798 [Columba livia]|nr:hypothetical protein Q9966_006798 [Columba livia]